MFWKIKTIQAVLLILGIFLASQWVSAEPCPVNGDATDALQCSDAESGRVVDEHSGSQAIRRWFSESGALELEATHIDGRLNGPSRWFTDHGTVAYEAEFKDGLQHGFVRAYYPDGTIKFKATYQYGQLHGWVRWFRADGSLRVEQFFAYGQPQGTVRLGAPTVHADLTTS